MIFTKCRFKEELPVVDECVVEQAVEGRLDVGGLLLDDQRVDVV